MNDKVGSPVKSCPLKGKKSEDPSHKNCAIKILSIKEPDGEEFKACANEIHVKSLNKPLRIKYQVKVCSMKVTLWIEYDAGNKIHSDFYKTYEGKGVTGNRVAIIVQGESKAPGTYEIDWDGRDKTPDHRILLDGTYTVRILGQHAVTLKDKTTIKFQIPFASNYGIHYHKGGSGLHSGKKEVEHAKKIQKKLKDGTAFHPEASVTEPALFAWSMMQVSSVVTISTHANPFATFFYPEESTGSKRAYYKKSKSSHITSFPKPKKVKKGKGPDLDNSVFLPSEPANALRDVFLVILAGCRTGNETYGIQKRLEARSKEFHPRGIDGKHGPKTTAALKYWQTWEGVKPNDGTKNPATLSALKIDPSLSERDQTIALQKKLTSFSKRYNPGKADGVWGDKTEKALTNYQEDHSPPLEVNSLPDKKTMKHLKLDGSEGAYEPSLVSAFLRRGCNVAFGFKRKVSFKACEKWHIRFWDQVAAGSGIEDAATEAKAMCGKKYAKELAFLLKSRSGVDKNSTLHPARHGRDL